MDLTVPYTFYPVALPHWIAWTLFVIALLSGAAVGVVSGRTRAWIRGIGMGMISTIGFLLLTMVASMVITFFVHDF